MNEWVLVIVALVVLLVVTGLVTLIVKVVTAARRDRGNPGSRGRQPTDR